MTRLQAFAFVFLPAIIALVGYVAVLHHERKHRHENLGPEFDYMDALMRYPFQVDYGKMETSYSRRAVMALAIAFWFSIGALFFSIVGNFLSQYWPDTPTLLFALIGGGLSAGAVLLVPLVTKAT